MLFRKTIFCFIARPYRILLFIYLFSSLSGFTQSLQTINLNEIPQKQVRHYIETRKINYMQNFAWIHASWKKEMDESAFHFREKIFYLKDKLSFVWECYRQANPTKSWNGHFVSFGLLITKCSNSVAYVNNCYIPEVDTGQVYFLDLRLMKGLLNVPIAFEIITIDPVLRIMEFSYIDGNKSLGKQTIQFYDNGDGRTRIIHRSYFKSDSPLRDDLLYPYFHKKLIKEFHRNMKNLVREIKLSETQPGKKI